MDTNINQNNTGGDDPEGDALKQKIKDQYSSLPKVIQDAISESGWEQKLRGISERNRIQIGDAKALETETLFVMLGLTHPNDYTNNIKEELQLDDARAKKVAAEINNTILRPIKQHLVDLFDEEEGGTPLSSPAALAEAPTEKEEDVSSREPQISDIKVPVESEIDKTPDPIKQKISEPTKTKTETYSIDPYRETIE